MSWSRGLRSYHGFSPAEQFGPLPQPTRARHVERRTRRDLVLLEHQLPPSDVVPAIQLVADVAVHTNWLEAHRLVQRDAGRIRQRDSGERIEVALRGQNGEERG